MRITTYFSLLLMGVLLSPVASMADYVNVRRQVSCPVIADRQTGRYSSSKAKYRCYVNSSDARKAGYSRHSFVEDSSVGYNCNNGSDSTSIGGGASGDFNYSGPGQKETVVFSALNGGTISYTFPGGGKFEIKVLSASSGNRLQQVVETTQAGTDTVVFAPQSTPITIKIQGPGNWTAAIHVKS